MKLRGLNEFRIINEGTETLKLKVPKDVLEMNSLFKKAGHQLYVVGGAVRDALLGISPKDWDLATDAKPEKIKQILHKYKFKEIGEAFGIVFIIAPSGNEYELATFREDVTAGRRPDAVKFSTINKDVLRRDLTINALFYDIDKQEIVDLVGGVKDLETKNIRTVGTALDRFGEDALRKLRAIRFAARIGGKIDKDIHNALIEDNSLPQVSFPRIHDEFKGGIEKAKKASYYLSLVEQYNFWDAIFPGFEINKKFINTSNWNVQLAELLKPNDINNISKDLRIKYSYTEEETNSIEFMHFLLKIDLKTNLLEALSKVNKKGVNQNDAIIFGQINGIDRKLILGLFRHKITTKGNGPEVEGLKGPAIRDKIQEIELDYFIKKWL
jgi:tRNA nucleotidyltransferase/poly(A) polymerase